MMIHRHGRGREALAYADWITNVNVPLISEGSTLIAMSSNVTHKIRKYIPVKGK